MKTRSSSYLLRAEARLKEVLHQKFYPATTGNSNPQSQRQFSLSPAVTEVLSSHLGLDPTWPTTERWIDYVEFSSLTRAGSQTIKIAGTFWWGYLDDIGGAQTPEALTGEMALRATGSEPELFYDFTLNADGMCRQITRAGIRRVASPDAPDEPDLTELIAALKSKTKDAPKKSPIIHVARAALIKNARAVIACTLACAGPSGIAALIAAIHEDDLDVRAAAIYALGLVRLDATDASTVLPVIIRALGDDDQQCRCLAAVALCRIAGEDTNHRSIIRDAVPLLIAALKEESYRDRAFYRDNQPMAVRALARAAQAEPAIIPALIAALNDQTTLRSAAHALSELGPDASAAIPLLAIALRDKDHNIQNTAAFTLWRLGAAGEDVLIGALKDENLRVREKAVMAIGEYASQASRAIPALIEALTQADNDAYLRCRIAHALAEAGLDRQDALDALTAAIPELVADLQGQNQVATRYAAETLSRMGRHAQKAVPALTAMVTRPEIEDYPRQEIIKALGHIGAAAEGAIPALSQIASSYETHFDCAIEALTKIGPQGIENAIAALLNALKTHPGASYTICEALQQIGTPALAALVELTKETAERIRLNAIRALGAVRPFALAVIIDALTDSRFDVRIAAAKALSEIGPEAGVAIPTLRKALHDHDLGVCARAAEALASIGAESVTGLLDALTDDDPFTVKWAAHALGEIGPAAYAAIPALMQAQLHDDAEVREIAAFALTEIAPSAQ